MGVVVCEKTRLVSVCGERRLVVPVGTAGWFGGPEARPGARRTDAGLLLEPRLRRFPPRGGGGPRAARGARSGRWGRWGWAWAEDSLKARLGSDWVSQAVKIVMILLCIDCKVRCFSKLYF